MKTKVKTKIRRLSIMTLLVSLLASSSAFAKGHNPENYTSVNVSSELLPSSAKQHVAHAIASPRGTFFAGVDLTIKNNKNGNIGAFAKAYLDHAVDEVYITIYLDRLDETANRWRQVEYYDAEFYAKDFPNGLTDPTLELEFRKQEKGYYYRLRGAYSAIDNGKLEGFSSTTSGILID